MSAIICTVSTGSLRVREASAPARRSRRFHIHQHITDKIVTAIERGAGEFRFPAGGAISLVIVGFLTKRPLPPNGNFLFWKHDDQAQAGAMHSEFLV